MSADAQFTDFVERQQKLAPVEGDNDWSRKRDEWLETLRGLYSQIGDYLDEFIKKNAIRLQETPIELNEEGIGVYKAQRLAIVIGAQEIVLTPVGTLLIGSKGRVDVEGSAGTSRLVLIDKDVASARSMFRVNVRLRDAGDSSEHQEHESPPTPVEWMWKIVSRPPAMRFIELNNETFFEMLMEVSNS